MLTTGERLKKLRLKHEMSQHTLARKAGLSQSHICKIEIGESPLSERYETVLAKIFKVKRLR